MPKEVSGVKLYVENDKEYRDSYQGHQAFVEILLRFSRYQNSPF